MSNFQWSALRGKLRKLRENSFLDRQVGVLELDIDVAGAEGVGESRELGLGVGRAVLLERAADAAGEAAGERDQGGAVAGKQLPVDARLVVVALEVAEAGEVDQVGVARVVGGKEREVGVPLRLGATVVGDVDLAADQRLDPCPLRILEELDGARHRAVVGEADGRHLELGGAGDEIGDPAGPVENRVLGVDVQVNEGRLRHAEATLSPGQDRTQLAGFRELARSGDSVRRQACRL